MRSRAFTLIELLVVIATVALLMAILLPSLSKARRAGIAIGCLANVRSLETAHVLYYDDHRGDFIDAGLSHGGLQDESVAWVNTLSAYHGGSLVTRSPGDASPHWPIEEGGDGIPIKGTTNRFRRTSYGINDYTARSVAPSWSETFDTLAKVPHPHATVHFLMIVEGTSDPKTDSPFAGSDHVHVVDWANGPKGIDSTPLMASTQSEIHAHGGRPASWESIANWAFLDGHASTLKFSRVYETPTRNAFHPRFAR